MTARIDSKRAIDKNPSSNSGPTGVCGSIGSSVLSVVSGTDVRLPDNASRETKIGRSMVTSGEMVASEQPEAQDSSILGIWLSDCVASCWSVSRFRYPGQHSRHAQRCDYYLGRALPF